MDSFSRSRDGQRPHVTSFLQLSNVHFKMRHVFVGLDYKYSCPARNRPLFFADHASSGDSGLCHR